MSGVCQVYWNVNKKCWSIRDKKTRLVVGHSDWVTLADVRFVVQEGGRQRVLREKRKNVHAWAEGRVVGLKRWRWSGTLVNYNPYKDKFFTDRASGAKVERVDRARLGPNGKVLV